MKESISNQLQKAKTLLPQKEATFTSNALRVFIIALLVCVILLLILTMYLTDYQRSLSQDAAFRLLKAYQKADASVFEKYNQQLPNAFESDASLLAYMELSFPKGEMYYYKGTSIKDGETVYEFKIKDVPIATLTTRDIPRKTFFGFQDYEVVTFIPHPIVYYTVTAPAGTPLFLDEAPINNLYMATQGYPAECFKDVRSEFISDIYNIPDYDGLGVLRVQGARPGQYLVQVDEKTCSVSVTPTIDKEKEEQIAKFADKFSRRYMVFATKKYGDRWPVLALSYPGTKFYNAVRIYGNEWGKEYVADRYENVMIDGYRKYADTEYSCHVSLTYVIVRKDGVVKNIDFSATYYLTEKTGKWLMADMVF